MLEKSLRIPNRSWGFGKVFFYEVGVYRTPPASLYPWRSMILGNLAVCNRTFRTLIPRQPRKMQIERGPRSTRAAAIAHWILVSADGRIVLNVFLHRPDSEGLSNMSVDA